MRTKVVPRHVGWPVALIGLSVCLLGCGDRIRLPSPERLVEFESAGPEGPSVDLDRISRARMPAGPYRVTHGDVLQLTMPLTLFPGVPQGGAAITGEATRRCRVDDAGVITIPDGRQIAVAGRSLSEIESAVVDAYYPEFVKTKPSVYAEVLEYRAQRVQILGSVTNPGVYSLRHDQMSLAALLMEAGGITSEGAAVIRITRRDAASGQPTPSPDRGLAPLRDVRGDRYGAPQKASQHRGVRPGGALSDTDSLLRVWFRPEGPLATTGWIGLEREGEVLVRQWLDVANDPQKGMLLEAAAARVDRLPVAVLDRRLLQLERMLLSYNRKARVHLAVYTGDSDWHRSGEGDYVAWLADASQVDRASHGMAAPTEQSAAPLASPSDAGETTIALPVRGLNIPFVDVALKEGDSVIVERLQIQYVTVLGLVRSPGNFPYPVGTQFRLAEVLAFAGGLDMVASPRYVSIYRLRADGTVASATFQLVDPRNQEELTAQLALPVRPGDVVSVEHTPRTRTNTFLDRYFRLSMGVYLRPEQLWGD